ncbi:aldo/keto reductase [Rubritalea profundi]|uniref:L-glyceraldehyde 3-phosphate reductase n=1 Tax=Rubritalea profundi TaxID=1658618 RepID=A0A2S7U4N7_9BACT|nr:aldo/keto reductase [Rubritalea profundi]PQJ29979.1 L-glyceraldehyde 3-phosphate reductase [Rubritalea profundi]
MPLDYTSHPDKYDGRMPYNRCGKSGLKLPAISLGLWHNFGKPNSLDMAQAILKNSFDAGITHFDLANNYGPPPGRAEINFGKIFHTHFSNHRHELIISTKAGYLMWDGPYGEWGSRKYILNSLDQSLQRMQLDYVDIFYHHRPDLDTPLEESMGALATAVQQGKALYAGISNYPADKAAEAIKILKEMNTPCLIHQPRYSLLDRGIEDGLTDVLDEHGVGCITFSPLAQGQLTNRYLEGIPANSRAGKKNGFLTVNQVNENIGKVRQLANIADARGQSLAQMALAWTISNPTVTSTLIGASSVKQLQENLKCLNNCEFSHEELALINGIV